ncbi:hypothetical protein RB195_010485 [Necator americanus]|uniref:Uncharacterized protein n=1 Tax=Necator americanus TaxID=51031 RepID=A0ABR1CY55_NECAM
MLRKLLKEGIKTLLLAASKVAPAIKVSQSQEVKGQLECLEQLMKSYHELTVKMHKSNEAKVDKVGMKMELLSARFTQIEKYFKEKIKGNEKYLVQWQQLDDEIKEIRDELSALNVSQLSFDIRGLHERFDEIISPESATDTVTTNTPAEPSPDLNRIRGQMDKTEREIH